MHSWILLKQLLLSPSWPLSQQPISPSASWAIDSEPIWARGIIVKYINDIQIICYNITLYMRMILYTLCTVVFHSNGQYIMLPAHCEVKTVDQG